MPQILTSDFERRVSPRVTINGELKYKLEGETDFREGVMLDLSQSGTLISLDQQLDIHTHLTLLIESDKDNEQPIEITAKIVRIANHNGKYYHTYGCMILDVKDV